MDLNPFGFLEGVTTKQKKKRSREHELMSAEELKEKKGRAQAGSGAPWGAKGDVKDEEFLQENKFTDKKGFRITVDLWEEICQKAFAEGGKRPALEIQFNQGVGKPPLRLMVIDREDYLALRGVKE